MTEVISGPTTKIEVISLAATICGRQGFNTLAAGGAFALDGSNLFDAIVSAEFGSNRWRFAQAFVEMSTLTTLTPSFDGWQYYWTIPSDCIMLFYIDPRVEFLVFGERVLTKTNQSLTAVYSKTVPVSKWPPAFAWYIAYEIAATLGISVTNSDRMLARIESKAELWHSRALFSDGQSSSPNLIKRNPYVSVRYQTRTRGR